MDPRITTAARLQQQKNYPQAEQIYRTVLANQPRNIDALLLLGLLQNETGRNEESVATLRAALKIEPGRHMVRQTLVNPLLALGRMPEAIAEARELVRLLPMVPDMQYLAGHVLLQAGDFASALPYARRAVELKPQSVGMMLSLIKCLRFASQTAQALAVCDQALRIEPHNAGVLFEAAILRHAQGELDQAIQLYESNLRLEPRNVAALNNLGNCFLLQNRSTDAVRCYLAAAELWPNSPQPRNNIGAVYKEMGQIDLALPQFQQAAAIDPTYADAYCNIGACHTTLAQHPQAIAAYREALRLKPDFDGVHSNLLLSLLSPVDVTKEQVFAEHCEFDRAHCQGLPVIAPPCNGIPANRRIRIGYVSPDFREHSIRYFMQPIFAAHDRSQFEIICYAAGKRRDEITAQLANMVDAWHFVADLTHDQLASMIRSHGIDILIDLAGHTADNRLLTFARKPAPVQATYLGYPTTTGLSSIDFRLTDAICDPAQMQKFYSERLLRLPDAFFVYGDDPAAGLDPTPPVDRTDVFTFGSFNSFTKISEPTLQCWANILHAVPNSRLLMKARPLANPSTRQYIVQFISSRGIPEDRLVLHAWVTLPEHQRMLASQIDVMLDTYPYNGHTTSCQAIWRGVPIVTLSGDSFRSRVGECILRQLGLPELIAHSPEEYEQIAIALANDLPKLRELRPLLRQRLINAPIGNAPRFVRALEDAYRQMLSIKSAQPIFERARKLFEIGQIPQALGEFQTAMLRDPTNSGGMNNLGACYLMLKQVDEGLRWLTSAAEANPHDPRARSNIGAALEDLQRFDEAIEQYRAATAIDPTFVPALSNCASVQAMLGRHHEAEATCRQVLRIKPDSSVVHSNLLLSMIQREDVSEEQVLAEHRDWARCHAAAAFIAPPKRERARLRIGYVSPDFREHSVRYFVAPLLRNHDRSKVEVFCYSATASPDAMTQQLRAMADGWRDVFGMDDQALARQIREDQIDILVDLAGHTGEHRLLTFALKPAPVQVTYLGYPSTTGLPAIDYRLTDSIADPVGVESYCSEQLVRLPDAFFVFDGEDSLPFDASLPAQRNGFLTFGSINNFSKIGPSTQERWTAILRGTQNSRLVMINKAMGNQSTRELLVKFFGDRGVAADRLELLSPMGLTEYYRRISEMDVTLDPLPFNGHTTTCHSIWMGVPVLTLAGNSFRGRMGKSVLTHLGLPEFVAESSEQYVARGIALASDLDRLAEVRRTLRDRMRASVLCDGAKFTAGLEAAYLQMMKS